MIGIIGNEVKDLYQIKTLGSKLDSEKVRGIVG